MLMIALTAREFHQSPYEYLFGPRLKLAIDYLAFSLITEAQEEAKQEAEQKNNPQFPHGGLWK